MKHYQQAPQVAPALALMVRAYHKLHMDKEADDALRVLELNYPDSPYLRSVVSELSAGNKPA